jgi:hypothetical protein
MKGEFDDKLDGRLGDAAGQYNEPPETPRDAMWARVLAGKAERNVTRMPKPTSIWRSPRMWVPAAAAAVLLIGIAIGRYSTPGDIGPIAGRDTTIGAQQVSTESPGREPNVAAYQLAAIPIFSQAELLLTQFRTGDIQEENGESFTKRAASLLTDTRLLLDSPAAEDPKMRRLLGDLELVLVQMVRMTAEDEQEEKELITENVNKRSLLPRLRANAVTGTFTSTY